MPTFALNSVTYTIACKFSYIKIAFCIFGDVRVIFDFFMQRSLNELKEIPDHYRDYEFWNKFQHDFYEQIPNIAKDRFQELSNSKEEFLHYSEGLLENLKEQSYKLCEEYDIPADPIEWESRNRYSEYSN